MNEDTIANALGIPPQEVVPANKSLVPVANTANTDLDNDYSFARQNLYDVLTKGTAALEELVEIAKQSQHPRAYEVLATMIKNLGDTNDKLLALQKQIAEIKTENEPQQATTIHADNAVFVGTTAELLELRNQSQKKLPPK